MSADPLDPRPVRLAVLVFFACAAPGTALADVPLEWREKVHPRVLREASSGPTDFILFMDEQADLSFADPTQSREERGRRVFEELTATAARTQAPLVRLLESLGAEYRTYWIANMIWVRADRDVLRSVAERVEVRRIDANPRIGLSRPAPVRQISGAESLTSIEWNVNKINAPQVWAMGYDGSGIVIGGQDTGYEWEHPTLKSAYRGWNGEVADHDYNWHDAIHAGGGICGADSPIPCDDHNHGTHTMGTMVGDDGGANQIGVSPGARWIGCRNMDQTNGTPMTYTECFQWFVAPTDSNGDNPDPSRAPHVINNSWSCPPTEGCSALALRSVVDNTRAAGIVVVASAGNSGSDCSTIDDPPAIYGSSFSVGATTSSDTIASFSSRGPVTADGSGRMKPDVSAPGVGVRSAIRGGGYASLSGTSMSGPHVVGLVALLLDARPDLIGQVFVVEEMIARAALPLTSTQICGDVSGLETPNNTFGHGRVDALEALLDDADDDGVNNLGDCQPVNGSIWDAPSPAVDLRLSQEDDLTALTWQAPAVPGGLFVSYDVLRSSSADGFSEASCVDASLFDEISSDDLTPDDVFFYLVRVQSGCGENLGVDSSGGARDGASCLSPQ